MYGLAGSYGSHFLEPWLEGKAGRLARGEDWEVRDAPKKMQFYFGINFENFGALNATQKTIGLWKKIQIFHYKGGPF